MGRYAINKIGIKCGDPSLINFKMGNCNSTNDTDKQIFNQSIVRFNAMFKVSILQICRVKWGLEGQCRHI